MECSEFEENKKRPLYIFFINIYNMFDSKFGCQHTRVPVAAAISPFMSFL